MDRHFHCSSKLTWIHPFYSKRIYCKNYLKLIPLFLIVTVLVLETIITHIILCFVLLLIIIHQESTLNDSIDRFVGVHFGGSALAQRPPKIIDSQNILPNFYYYYYYYSYFPRFNNSFTHFRGPNF